MKKIILIALSLVALVSCEMDFYRSDTMTSSQLKDNPAAAVYTTAGNYALFKDGYVYNGSDSGHSYVRHWFQMSEFRSDNLLISAHSTDPLFEAMTYTDNPTLKNLNAFWALSYKIIYGANSNIESMLEGSSDENDHILGENYFMRALVHLNLLNLYSRPYTCGKDNVRRDNPGVVLRTSNSATTTERATVGACYDQIVLDLEKAIELMSKYPSGRGNKGYASSDAAKGLLTRVYLHMGMDDKVIQLAGPMLGGSAAAAVDKIVSSTELKDYFINAKESKETLWCVAHVSTETWGGSSIGGMYYNANDGTDDSWCEIYYSDPLIELFNRYPQDKRLEYFYSQLDPTNDGNMMVYWPVVDEDHSLNIIVHGVSPTQPYTFSYDNKTYTVKEKMLNKEKIYYIEGSGSDPDDVAEGRRVYIRPDVSDGTGTRNSQFPKFMCYKFGGQDGDTRLSSPVMIRWAEVILNLAEAYARTGADQDALDYVNVIRNRAGIPEMTLANMAENGYDDVLDVVLDERRMEFHHEGFRGLDLYRNGKPIDRRYAGYHEWKEWTVQELETSFYYSIPIDEINVSGIAQNDGKGAAN